MFYRCEIVPFCSGLCLAFNPASFACHVRHGGFVLWRIERGETSLILFRARSVGRIDPEIPLPPMRHRNDRAMTLNTHLFGQFHQSEQCVIHRHGNTKLRTATGNVAVECIDLGQPSAIQILRG